MKKIYHIIAILLIGAGMLNGQILFQEDFESTGIPSGWSIESNASDGGWRFANPGVLSSQFYTIPSNGSAGIAATNDDACNCNKSSDRLIMPAIDLSGVSAAVIKFDAHFFDGTYQGFQEDAFVEASTDGVNWQTLRQLSGTNVWRTEIVNLEDFVGEPSVIISFRYADNGGWMFGMGLDNVIVEEPNTLDVAFNGLTNLTFGLVGDEINFKGELFNNGITPVNEVQFTLSVDGQVQWMDNASITIGPFSSTNFELEQTWVPDATGTFLVQLDVVMVNGREDDISENNTQLLELDIFENVRRENKVREIIDSEPVISEVANAFDGLFGPTDLDFFPILGRDELWVINRRTEDEGGSTLTISDASADEPSDMLIRVDGNAWHFMSLPTAIEFSSENLNFATSPGVQDANHNGGTFTGPTLWSSDPLIYAQPSGGNGSHLDMLHGSPFSLGIAHEVDNAWWVYDNWNKDIVRYDFVEDHGPGNDDHSDALVRRFKNIGLNGDNEYPSHMILDKESGWLYFVDNGNARVLRMDINSGTQNTPLSLINEPLAEHSQVTGATVETIINSGLNKPCGIELIDNYLLVSDFDNGDIIVYDMSNNFQEMDRIFTDRRGITGLKIGPDGSIWYTNMMDHTLNKVQAGEPTSLVELASDEILKVYPNPFDEVINIKLTDSGQDSAFDYQVVNMLGQVVLSGTTNSSVLSLNLRTLNSGAYNLVLIGDDIRLNKQIVKQ